MKSKLPSGSLSYFRTEHCSGVGRSLRLAISRERAQAVREYRNGKDAKAKKPTPKV